MKLFDQQNLVSIRSAQSVRRVREHNLDLSFGYTFDADDRLAGEKIYYDRATVLRQLGVFHEPQTILGQISILATHPATIARAIARKFLSKCAVSIRGHCKKSEQFYKSLLLRLDKELASHPPTIEFSRSISRLRETMLTSLVVPTMTWKPDRLVIKPQLHLIRTSLIL